MTIPFSRRRVDWPIVVFFALNLPWLLMPLYIVARLWRSAEPFASGVTR